MAGGNLVSVPSTPDPHLLVLKHLNYLLPGPHLRIVKLPSTAISQILAPGVVASGSLVDCPVVIGRQTSLPGSCEDDQRTSIVKITLHGKMGKGHYFPILP